MLTGSLVNFTNKSALLFPVGGEAPKLFTPRFQSIKLIFMHLSGPSDQKSIAVQVRVWIGDAPLAYIYISHLAMPDLYMTITVKGDRLNFMISDEVQVRSAGSAPLTDELRQALELP